MRNLFGKTSAGEEAYLYELKNGNGMSVLVSDYGATIVGIIVPDGKGGKKDVVLGYDDVSGYEAGTCFFGGVIGRVANRIGGAQFELGGKTYCLAKNDHGNTLHSGVPFTSQRIWNVAEIKESGITLSLYSPDMDQGYPGNVELKVTYHLTEENELVIRYAGVPDRDTLLNLTNHSYFNLAGHDSGDILSQEVVICADAFTRADVESIPTGEIVPVEGTPMDFRTPKEIGQEIEADYEALRFGEGYDHNYVLNGAGMRKVAAMSAKETKISMEVYTDLPGMQFYTANFVDGEKGKEGAVYGKRSGACFETQYFPDAVHKENFASPIVRGGEEYHTTTVYKFYRE